ncbi:MAG: EamA family transporter [Candidatus Woesearchaeota archaeon]
MWFLYAIISGVLFGLNSLVVRYYSKKHKDSLITSFYFSFLSAIILLPFFIYEAKISNTYVFWGGILLLGAILVLNNLLSFKAAQLVGPTATNTIFKIRLLWILIIGIWVFNEKITWINFLGMVMILVAALLIVDFKNWNSSKKGVLFLLITTITAATIAFLLKQMLTMSGVASLTFLIFLMPAIINAAVIPNFFKRAIKNFSNIKLLVLIALLGVLANFSLVKALSYDALAGIFFIMDASFIIILFGEYIWLKEKERILWKIASVILAIIGTVLIYIK